MFKDTFKLRKSSWHAKLMKYTFNMDAKDFDHLCPYFWMTIFNIIIFPIFGPIKFIIKTVFGLWVKTFFEYVADSLENYKEKKRQKLIKQYEVLFKQGDYNIIKNLNLDRDCPATDAFYNLQHELRTKVRDQQDIIIEKENEEKEKEKEKKKSKKPVFVLKSVIQTDEELERKKLLEKERKIKIKQKITKIVLIIKPLIRLFVYFIASSFILVALYFFYKFIIILTEVKPKYYINIGRTIGLVLIAFAGIFILYLLVTALLNYLVVVRRKKIKYKEKKVKKEYKIIKNLKTIFKYVVLPFIFIFKYIFKAFAKLGKALKEFIQIIKQIYKKECPAIDWED